MTKMTFAQKYQAITKKDTSVEGVFFTGVKTTGIFCRPSCRARTPKFENVIFYHTAQEALQHGFRPCKICKPMEAAEEAPVFIQNLIKEIHQKPYSRIQDYDLKKRGLAPSLIRRWFKKNHHMTFQTYQRMLRINTAFNSIQEGKKVIDSAFESGYESLSGFNDSYQAIFGESPTGANERTVLNIVRFSTPLGPMYACASKKGLCLLDFTDRRMLETEFKDLRKRLTSVILPGKNKYLEQVQLELKQYFEGKRKKFTVPLDAPGTPFQQAVWKVLQGIPYGEVRSYKQQAIALGNPKAIRAVASANGHNRISIIIPCHRVIGADGTLVGYGGGLHRKKWLLDFEQNYKKR